MLDQTRAIWGEEGASNDEQASFFVDGVQGVAWVVNLGLLPARRSLKHLKILHLGDYTDLSTDPG
ncbi:hypothetical protein [Ideonella sp. A 288]|uniref:hypothetical protein n=1 Tax=Ideonella sp. A 288 TaxID=1962181 RepID=UPI000B4BFBB5|nr:hypothetical protein [Ideonella sp. A 288]